MKRSQKKNSSRKGALTTLAILLLVLSGLLLLRTNLGETAPPAASLPAAAEVPSAGSLPPETPQTEQNSLPVLSPSEPSAVPEPTSTAAEPRNAPGYNAETYQIVSDMIHIRRSEAPDGDAQIEVLEKDLKKADPALGATWAGIMDYWQYANREMPINHRLPDDLPRDDSLCLVVLGFQLLYDGDMAPELLGRCEVALQCARQYPNAFIAVTGGGTAYGDRTVTEAGVMAEWFRKQGIAAERIIVEEASLTTDQNAVNTCAILMRDYPQVSELAIISSDYHLPLGCTLFTEAALLNGFYHGEVPYTVVSNAAWATDGSTPGYRGMKNQASYVWIMADPKY